MQPVWRQGIFRAAKHCPHIGCMLPAGIKIRVFGHLEGQVHGGIAQGLGYALMEEYLPGRTENLHHYLIPTIGDVPEIEVLLVEDEEPLGPYGAKGIGEPAIIPTAAATMAAIRHATGAIIRKIPALPHRVMEAIAQVAE